jgi:uncharacterized SAM-binding protein YcdF (DUF218 family)
MVLVVWLFSPQILTWTAAALVEDDGPQKSDAIVVLGGDEYGERVIRGAELAKAGYAPVVYVSGPANLLGASSDIEIQYAERRGYPASYFRSVPLVGEAGDSTRTEARFLGKLLRSQGLKKILLVTSVYHTRRAARLWRLECPWLAIDAVPAPDPNFSPGTWWKTRQGQKTFILEWTKTIAAALGD